MGHQTCTDHAPAYCGRNVDEAKPMTTHKSLRIAGLLLACVLNFRGGLYGQDDKQECSSCGVIDRALASMSHIKPGMLRTQLEEEFRHDGGLSFGDEKTTHE